MLHRIAVAAPLVAAALAFAVPAHALTMKECSAKYQAAKQAGKLNGMKWSDFRKTECAAGAAASSTAGSAPASAGAKSTKEPAAATMKAPNGVVFPSAVDKKYSSETPGKARMHTCLDQYRINKAKNTLGGLKWIQKGGGYYSLCNARLKG